MSDTRKGLHNYDVFISYSRADKKVVAPITNLLRVTNSSIFRDEDSIVPGKEWAVAVTSAIESSHAVVVFWSVTAADSIAVREEYELAEKTGKSIVPVLLDDTPLVPELSKYQWIDFREIVSLGKSQALKKAARSVAGPAGAAAAAISWIPGASMPTYSYLMFHLAEKVDAGLEAKFGNLQEARIQGEFACWVARSLRSR